MFYAFFAIFPSVNLIHQFTLFDMQKLHKLLRFAKKLRITTTIANDYSDQLTLHRLGFERQKGDFSIEGITIEKDVFYRLIKWV